MYLPVRPGTDLVAVDGHATRHVARRSRATAKFIDAHTTGIRGGRGIGSRRTIRARRGDEPGFRPTPSNALHGLFATAERAVAMHARGAGAPVEGRRELPGADQPLSGHRQYRPRRCGLHDDHGPRQWPGRPRARTEVRPAARASDRSAIPAARAHVAKVWGISPERSAAGRVHSGGDHGSDPSRRDQSVCYPICFNPLVSLPDANYTREALEKLEYFGVVDFFMSETAHHADVVLAGSLQEEEEGIVCSAEGRVIHIQKAVDPPGNARGRQSDLSCDLARRLGKGEVSFRIKSTARDLRRTARGIARRHRRLLRHHLRKNRQEHGRVLAVSHRSDHPGTPRLFEGGVSFHADGKCRFIVTRVARERRSRGQRTIRSTSRRAASSASISRARRRGGLAGLVDQYPEPRVEIHPRLAEQYAHRRRQTGSTVTSRRSDDHAAGDGGEDDPAGHRLHPVPLAGRTQRQPADASNARSAQQDSGVQSLGLSLRKADGPPTARPRRRGTSGGARDVRLRILRRSVALHRLPVVREGVRGVRNAPGQIDDQFRLHRPRRDDRDGGLRLLALRGARRARMVCPADAIKKGEDGIVQSSLEAALHRLFELRAGMSRSASRRLVAGDEQMMKCDMCYDRTSVGKKPMCATVCPSQALAYVAARRRSPRRGARNRPTSSNSAIRKSTTKVYMMVPAETSRRCRSTSSTTCGRESYAAFSQPQ